eukprot:scaffold1228_cov246-Pinguiococcus_pyrenoidosus.AAC.23
MRQQQGLELRRGDLHALVLDELLASVGDVQEAIFVEVADIPGAHVAVGRERLFGVLGTIQVALHDLWPLDDDFAGLIGKEHFLRLGVDDSAAGVGHELADASAAGARIRVVDDGARGAQLGHAPSLLDDHARELAGKCGFLLGPQRRGCGHERPQGAQVELGDGRVREKPVHDRRHHVRPGDFLVLDGLEEVHEVELGREQNAAPLHQTDAKPHAEAVDVEERQREVEGLAALRILRVCWARLVNVGDQIAVREHDSLRQARRAAAEGKQREVFGLGRVGKELRSTIQTAAGHLREGVRVVVARLVQDDQRNARPATIPSQQASAGCSCASLPRRTSAPPPAPASARRSARARPSHSRPRPVCRAPRRRRADWPVRRRRRSSCSPAQRKGRTRDSASP